MEDKTMLFDCAVLLSADARSVRGALQLCSAVCTQHRCARMLYIEDGNAHIDDRYPHEGEQPLALVVMLLGDSHSALAILGNVLLVSSLHIMHTQRSGSLSQRHA